MKIGVRTAIINASNSLDIPAAKPVADDDEVEQLFF